MSNPTNPAPFIAWRFEFALSRFDSAVRVADAANPETAIAVCERLGHDYRGGRWIEINDRMSPTEWSVRQFRFELQRLLGFEESEEVTLDGIVESVKALLGANESLSKKVESLETGVYSAFEVDAALTGICNTAGVTVKSGPQYIGRVAAEVIAHVVKLKDDLELERLRLAGCSVIASSNTREALKDASAMHERVDCYAIREVMSAVNREIKLREDLELLRSRMPLESSPSVERKSFDQLVQEQLQLKLSETLHNRERFVAAWVAETGFLPSQACMVEHRLEDGTTRIHIERRIDATPVIEQPKEPKEAPALAMDVPNGEQREALESRLESARYILAFYDPSNPLLERRTPPPGMLHQLSNLIDETLNTLKELNELSRGAVEDRGRVVALTTQLAFMTEENRNLTDLANEVAPLYRMLLSYTRAMDVSALTTLKDHVAQWAAKHPNADVPLKAVREVEALHD
jgi:hypothetical protein